MVQRVNASCVIAGVATGPLTCETLLSSSVLSQRWVLCSTRPLGTLSCSPLQLEMPIWVQGDVLDVRFVVLQWVYTQRSIGVDEEVRQQVCNVNIMLICSFFCRGCGT